MTKAQSEAVIWHDVECGSYDADLPLWRELAGAAPGPVLEVGCGAGRVAIHLARCGHEVTGIDSEAALVAALDERARNRRLEVAARVGDARALDLEGRFGLIAAPMQVLQLLPGAGDRKRLLAGAARHLAPGGTVAISIVEGVPAQGGEVAQPLPDVADIDGWVYSSLPLEIAADGDDLVVIRLRQVVSPAGELTETVDETRLAVLGAATVEREAAETGLRLAERREVPSTADHVGSTVVLLEAP